jgi:hypothetical protein
VTDKTRYPAFSRTNPGNIIQAQAVCVRRRRCENTENNEINICRKYMALPLVLSSRLEGVSLHGSHAI